MKTPSLIRAVGWSGTEWAWFALILTASAVFWPPFPDGGVPRLLGVFALAVFGAFQIVRWRNFDRLDLLIVAVALYAVSSNFWAVDPHGAFGASLTWVALAVIAVAARRMKGEGPILAAVTLSALTALLAHAVQPEYHAGFGNENFATWWFIAAFPALLAAFMRWPAFVAPIFLFSIIYIVFWNEAHIEVAPIAAWLVVLAYIYRPSAKWIAPIGGIFIAALLIGLVPESVTLRLELWQAALGIWWANPIFGAGLGGFDTLFGVYAPAGEAVTNSEVIAAGAAHSDALQALSELGLVGTAIIVAALWAALRPQERHVWPVYTIIGLLALACIDFPLQMPASALMGVIAFARLSPVRARSQNPLWASLLALPLVFMLIITGGAMLASQIYFSRTAAAYMVNPIAAHINNGWAVHYWPYDKHARRELFLTALISGASDEAVERGIAAARSAYHNNRRIEALIKQYDERKEDAR